MWKKVSAIDGMGVPTQYIRHLPCLQYYLVSKANKSLDLKTLNERDQRVRDVIHDHSRVGFRF